MIVWPRTEKVGLGTVGEGRGVRVEVSRNVLSCLDMLGWWRQYVGGRLESSSQQY